MTRDQFFNIISGLRALPKQKAVIYRFNRIGYYRHSAVIVLREEGVDFVCKRIDKDGWAIGQEFGLPKCEVKVIGNMGRVW